MFKRILKVVGIVLACTVVGLGVLVGVLALQGKFKKPYQEPNRIYIEVDNNTMNVTYYSGNLVVSQKDDRASLENKNLLNVYSFVLRAEPDNVTELDCTMVVESGAELIRFCDEKGNNLEGASLRSNIKINERVYFKLVDSFDDSNDTASYPATGEVKFYFLTENDLYDAVLTVKIERQANQVSLFDFKNAENNEHENGQFKFENDTDRITYQARDLNAKPESWANYYTFSDGEYTPVETDAIFDSAETYYVRTIDKTLYLTVEANSENKLVPIFAPNNSNKPFSEKDAKMCDIFYEDDGSYYRIGDDNATAEFIVRKDDGYYFNAKQAGKYSLYVVSYPTYAVQQKFLAEFESDNLGDLIFSNSYSIYREVVITVENSGVQAVTFNQGNTLNVAFNLFEYNSLAVHNAQTSATNLDITMYNNRGEQILSRYNQLKMLSSDDFIKGNIVLTSGDGKTIFIDKDSSTALLTGFPEGENGVKDYTIHYEAGNVILTIDEFAINFPSVINKDGIYRLSTATSESGNWVINNDILLVNVKTVKGESGDDELDCTLGTFAVGSYLVFTQDNGVVINANFEVESNNFGENKIFLIKPLESMTEVSLYCLIVNEDRTATHTETAVGIQVNYESTVLEKVTNSKLTLNIKYDGTTSTFKSNEFSVENLVSVKEGSYQYPLMFVKAETSKVHTIPQIYFEYGEEKYVLVGCFENGHFVHKIVPKHNVIGEQDIYALMVKYNCNEVKSVEDLSNMLFANLKGKLTEEGKQIYVYDRVELSSSTDLTGYYLKADDNTGMTALNSDYEFDATKVYYKRIDYLYNGALVAVNGSVWQIKEIEVGEKIVVKGDNEQSAEFEINDTCYKLVDNYDDFYTEPVASLNIEYVSKLDADDSEDANFEFYADIYKHNGTEFEKLEENALIPESTDGIIVDEDKDNLYIKIGLNEGYSYQELMTLIAGETNNNSLTGLNQYFKLKIKMYNANGSIAHEGNISYLQEEFNISNETIAKFIQIDKLSYTTEDKYIKVYFSILSDGQDSFGESKFSFEFSYGTETTESQKFVIESTAVTGYQFTHNGENYTFNDYKLKYKIGWNDGYTYTAYLVHKTDATEIELYSGEIGSLEDSELLKASDEFIINGKYITTSTGDNAEFAFTASSSNTNVIDVVNNTIAIKSAGNAQITLTNSVKTGVKSTFIVEVDASNFSLSTKNVEETINANITNLSDFLSFKYDTTISLLDTDIAGIVNFAISNVEPIEYEVAEGGQSILYKLANTDNTVLSILYDSQWQMKRHTEYVLHAFSFDLTVSTQFTDPVKMTFNYVTPVSITKNADNPMANMEVIDYYQGTSLQVSSAETTSKALYRLKDETGGETTFKLQYKWYQKVDNTTDKPYKPNQYYYFDNGEYKLLTSETYEGEYFEFLWIVISEGTTLKIENLANDLPIGYLADARIYYNDNKFELFKFHLLSNGVFTMNNGTGSAENTLENPFKLTYNTTVSVDLATNITAKKYTGTYFDYEDIPSEELTINSFSVKEVVNTTNNNAVDGMFNISEKTLNLNWVKETGTNLYKVILEAQTDNGVFEIEYYVEVSSNYEITKVKDLPSITAYAQTEIDIAEYFTIKNAGVGVTIDSFTIQSYEDSTRKIKDSKLEYVSGKLTYNYPYISGNVRYVVFTFTIDGNEITNNIAYPITINNYKLGGSDKINLTADTSYKFIEQFSDIKAFNSNDIWKIVVGDNALLSSSGEGMITDTSSNYSITPQAKGYEYTTKLNIDVYYDSSDESKYYSYELTIEVANPRFAQIGYKFNDLVENIEIVNGNNGIVLEEVEDIDLNYWQNFEGDLHYDPVLTFEQINNLTTRFKVFSNDDKVNALQDATYKLSSIELVATINLANDPNYLSKLVIDNTYKTISIGNFGRVGYAIFKLADSEGTFTYYTVRITPKDMGGKEKYTGVLDADSTTRKLVVDSQTTTDETTPLSSYIDSSKIASKISIDNSVLQANNLNFYLIEDNNNLLVSQLYLNVSDKVVNKVANPTTIKVAVVITTTNGVVYICDYEITFLPDVEITLGDGVEQLEGYYHYQTSVSYNSKTEYSFADMLTLSDSATISSVKITDMSNELGLDINGNIIQDENDNSVVVISTEKITLVKDIRYGITFTLTLTFTNGLKVTLEVEYTPYVNSVTNRTFNLGWNGSEFDNFIAFTELVGGYDLTNGITAKFNGETKSYVTNLGVDGFSFALDNEEQPNQELVITLDKIVGGPTFTYVINLGKNYQQTIVYGATQDDAITTILTESGSSLNIEQNASILKLTNGKGETDTDRLEYLSFIYEDMPIISQDNIKFVDLQGNEYSSWVNYDNGEIKFPHSASDIVGKLTIDIIGVDPIEVFVKMLKTYEVTAQYRVKGAEFETVLLGDNSITFDNFLSTSLNSAKIQTDEEVNKSRYTINYLYNNSNSELDVTSLIGINALNWAIYYTNSFGERVEDINNLYAKIENSTVIFTGAGSCYIRLFNATGLQVDYTIIVEESNYFRNNITWNENNINSGTVKIDNTTEINYYSTTIDTLSSADGYKLASLKFNPSLDGTKVVNSNYFRLFAKEYSNETASHTYNAGDVTQGTISFDDGLILKYTVTNYDIVLRLDSNSVTNIEFEYIDFYLITVNGVAKTIRLYITNIAVVYGMTVDGKTAPETIYANREGVALSGLTSTNAPRVTLKNDDTNISYNDGNGYDLYYDGWYNKTTLKEFAKDNVSIIMVKSDDNYKTDVFDINSVPNDIDILMHYYLTYNSVRIFNFDYNVLLKNDIAITMNNFAESTGNIYLANYNYNDSNKEFEVDLINKNNETNYRNEYIVYKNLANNKFVFNGETGGKTVSTFMKFEIVSHNYDDDNIPSVDDNGVLKIKADKEGQITLKVTAHNCPGYFVELFINVVPTISVVQRYNETQFDAGTDGYESLEQQTLISADIEKPNAMLLLTNQKTDDKYIVNTGNPSNFTIKSAYVIRESLAVPISNVILADVSLTGSMLTVTLPVVPFSSTQKYIVTYIVDITSNNTTRRFICNYQVKNTTGLTIASGYAENLKITIGEPNALNGSTLTIFSTNQNDTHDSLFKSSNNNPKLLDANSGAKHIKFTNIVDALGQQLDKEFDLDPNYTIDLGSTAFFSNEMTFDIVFLNADKKALYTSSGWTMTATNKVVPNNSKALTDLFTEAELNNELSSAEFVAVTTSTDASYSWFKTDTGATITITNVTEVKSGIQRGNAEYSIYSFIATRNEVSFYDLKGKFYFISVDPTYPTSLIEITNNYYISKVVNDVDVTDDLDLNVTEYAKVFDGGNNTKWNEATDTDNTYTNISDVKLVSATGETTSITIDNINNAVTVSDYTITINKEILEQYDGKILDFYINISGGGAVRENVRVRITVKDTNNSAAN